MEREFMPIITQISLPVGVPCTSSGFHNWKQYESINQVRNINIPREPGAYVVRMVTGSCLYVGRTKDLHQRCQQYLVDGEWDKKKNKPMHDHRDDILAAVGHNTSLLEIEYWTCTKVQHTGVIEMYLHLIYQPTIQIDQKLFPELTDWNQF